MRHDIRLNLARQRGYSLVRCIAGGQTTQVCIDTRVRTGNLPTESPEKPITAADSGKAGGRLAS